MKTIAILALVGIAATAFFAMSSGPSNDLEAQFREFLETYRVGYSNSDEYAYRLDVFAENMKKVEQYNLENPEAVFGVTQFSDRTPEEMERMMGLIMPAEADTEIVHVEPINASSVDWAHMWSSVKNQASCGSCWAFSAAAAFESRYALHKGSKTAGTSFSEQELVDCDTKSSGCNGGWMDNAFTYLKSHAFCTGAKYPYHAKKESCQVSKCAGGPTDKAFADIARGNENSVLSALAHGPISVAVDASKWSAYKSGIMSSCGTSLNHGVTLVGYDAGAHAVKIRNSWGSGWGEHGYIRLKTGNTCGYANNASYPTF